MQGYRDLIVGICDDEYYVHSIITEALNVNARNMGLRFSFLHFYSAYGLLSSKEMMDCLLLDIDMPETDGISANNRSSSYRLRTSFFYPYYNPMCRIREGTFPIFSVSQTKSPPPSQRYSPVPTMRPQLSAPLPRKYRSSHASG